MGKYIIHYNNLSNFTKTFISSISIAIPFYFSALLGSYISDSQQLSDSKKFALNATIFIVGITFVIFISKMFKFYQERLNHVIETEKATLFQAYTLCDRIITNRLKYIKN